MSFSSRKTAPNNVNLDESQTLQNKTLDGSTVIQSGADIQTPAIIDPTRADVKKDTLANLQTYASTASNGQLVYATDSKKMFQVLDGALAEVGGGSAGINYIENSDAEQDVAGWTNYANTTPGELPDDFGGSLGVFWTGIAVNSSNPLRGTRSFTFGADNSISEGFQGHGVYYDFTIDSADQAKKLTVSFDYLIDDSSLSNADDEFWRVYVYDVTNAQLIRVNGEDLALNAQSSTHYAQFQTASNSTSYRLVIHQAKDLVSTDSYQFKFDNVQVGPTQLTKGTIVTDWEEFTPVTGFTTNTTNTGRWRRVGDTMHIEVTSAFSGVPNSATVGIQIPNGLQIDTDKLPTDSGLQLLGLAHVYDNSTVGSGIKGIVRYNSSTDVRVAIETISNLNTMQTLTDSYPISFNAGDRFNASFKVPIQGWSSNAKMSEDLGGREVVVQSYGNIGQTVTANITNIPFGSTGNLDTTNSWNGSVFTVPETGYYDISYSQRFTAATQTTTRIYIGGVATDYAFVAEASTEFPKGAFTAVPLTKGDQVSLRNDVTRTLNSSGPHIHRISINKLASPQTILETETVAARYTSNSGQVIGTTATDMIFEDLDFDTHNSMNTSTGEYTIPTSGYYNINSSIMFDTAGVTWTSGEISDLNLFVNGSLKTALDYYEQTSTQSNMYVKLKGSDTLYLNKGDVIKFNSRKTIASQNLLASSAYNYVSISRVK